MADMLSSIIRSLVKLSKIFVVRYATTPYGTFKPQVNFNVKNTDHNSVLMTRSTGLSSLHLIPSQSKETPVITAVIDMP